MLRHVFIYINISIVLLYAMYIYQM